MSCRSFLRGIAAALPGLLAAAPAAAQQDVAALRTASLASTCAACHGTAGKPVSGASVPGLAGLPAAYLAEQMRAFKSGTRPATVMHQIAKGYNDAQIERMAAYFAAQPR